MATSKLFPMMMNMENCLMKRKNQNISYNRETPIRSRLTLSTKLWTKVDLMRMQMMSRMTIYGSFLQKKSILEKP
jgi:hypothetical protein